MSNPRQIAVESLEVRRLLAITPIGSEIRLNNVTANVQENVALAMDGDGNFAAAWETVGVDGDGRGIATQLFTAAGAGQGERIVNTYTIGNQADAAIAMDADGDYLIVWSSAGPTNPTIFGQRFSATGIPVGNNFQVNTGSTAAGQFEPAVAMDAQGNAVVVWTSMGQSAVGSIDVYAQRYNFNGERIGSEFLVNQLTTGGQSKPAVAMAADGRFVVAWEDDTNDGSGSSVYARRYTVDGLSGSAVRVNTTTAGAQSSPSVALDGAGNYLVAWTDAAADGSGLGVFAQRYNTSGFAQGGEFRVNTTTANEQSMPSVAASIDGKFTVVWRNTGPSGSNPEIRAQQFTVAAPIGGEFTVTATAAIPREKPSVAMSHAGDAVVAWHGSGSGDATGIHGRLLDESTDTAGPVFASAATETRRFAPYGTVPQPFGFLRLSVSEPLSTAGGTAGFNSAFNPANYRLTRDGLDISNQIAAVGFAYNGGAGRYELTLTLATVYTSGNFLVQAKSNLRDLAGNTLDGDANGTSGDPLLLPFSIGQTGVHANDVTVGGFDNAIKTPPLIASNAAGDSVMAWSVTNFGVSLFQLVDARGVPKGGVFAAPTGSVVRAITMDDAGNFIAAYAEPVISNSVTIGYTYSFQRFNAAGTAVGSQTVVDSYSSAGALSSGIGIAADSIGNFSVALSKPSDVATSSDPFDVFVRRYNANGTLAAGPVRVNNVTAGTQIVSSVASDSLGNVIVAYASTTPGGAVSQQVQRYDAAGVAQGANITVDDAANVTGAVARVAACTVGFVVTYVRGTGADADVYARLYNQAGGALTAPTRVHAADTNQQATPYAAMFADRSYVIAWQNFDSTGVARPFVRGFDAQGNPLALEQRASNGTSTNQRIGGVATRTVGEWNITWVNILDGGFDFFYAVELNANTINASPTLLVLNSSTSTVFPNQPFTLSTGTFLDDHAVVGTSHSASFYRESNGLKGLQVGAGGDSFLGTDNTPNSGSYSVDVNSSTQPPGGHQFYGQITDDEGVTGRPASQTVNIQSNTAPSVTQSRFAFDDTQFSLQFTFDRDLSPTLSPADLIITRVGGGAVPAVTLLPFNTDGVSVATFVFNSPLPDGQYTATLLAAGVTDTFSGMPLPANVVVPFFFFRGDLDRSGVVNNADIAAFVTGLTNPAGFAAQYGYRPTLLGDVNLDGVFNNADIAAFVSKLTGGRGAATRPGASIPDSEDAPRDRIASDVLRN